MYAVIKTGGKQYRVAPNDMIQIEKLAGTAGETLQFTDVLMIGDGGEIEIGAPLVAGATVVGEIAGQERGPKLIIFKKRRRHHYRRRNGHRQDLTAVRITEILTGGAKPAARAEEPAAAEKPADDVSLIGGIGPKISQALAGMGYESLAKIAMMKPEDVTKIEEELKMKGRIAREEWIEQARELIEGKPPRAKADKARKADAVTEE